MNENKVIDVLSKIDENITKSSSIENANRKLGILVSELSSLQEKIIKKELEIQYTVRLVNVIKSLKKRDFDSVSVDLLASDNRILDMSVAGKTIAMLTNDLYYNDQRTNRRHLLGKFLIESSFGSPRCTKAYNITMQVVGALKYPQDSPHTMFDHHCCLGNAVQLFEECLLSQDPTGLVILLLSFIESVNTEDASGAGVEYWPFITPEGLAAIDPKRIVKPHSIDGILTKFANLGLDRDLISLHLNDEAKFSAFAKSISHFKKSS